MTIRHSPFATRPFSMAELAARLGHGVDWLYDHVDELIAAGMPAPLSPIGRRRWERSTMEAWLTRHHPLRPPAAANDQAPPIVPASDAEHRAHLAQVYGAR